MAADVRTHEKFIDDVQDHFKDETAGKKKGKNPHGIKTATYFLALKDFNMVNGFSFDYMHTMLLGNLLHRDFNYN